jgi:hypothetical protein
MPIARFQLPDGRIAKFEVAEGTTPEEAQAEIERHLASVPPASAPAPKAESPISEAETIAGTPGVRFALGSASPFLGAAQLGAEAVGSTGISENLKQLEQMKQRGMSSAGKIAQLKDSRARLAKLPGYEAQIALIDRNIAELEKNPFTTDGGVDLAGLAGTVLSPAVLGAMKIPAAGSVLGRAGQGAGIGAAFGAASPVTGGDDFWSTKATQTGAGAVIGGVIPPAIDAGKKLYETIRHVLDPLLPGGSSRQAARVISQLVGERRPQVEAELSKATEIVPGAQPTAAEAAARAGSAELSGAQRILQHKQPSDYAAISRAQEEARRASIQSFGKDDQSLAAALRARAESADEAYGAMRNVKVDPRSDVEIMQDAISKARGKVGEVAANEIDKPGVIARNYTGQAGAQQVAGRMSATANQARVQGENFVPVPGMPRVSARASNYPEVEAEARKAMSEAIEIAKQRHGEAQFLENTLDLLKQTVGMEQKSLQFFLNRPSVKEALKDAMQSAQETGSYFPTRAGEKLSVGNLQRIKESLDAGIEAAQNAAKAGRRPELSAQELESTKKAFVKWLSSKVPEWQAARHDYLLKSRSIDEMRVGQQLEEALTKQVGEGERAVNFGQAMRDAPRTIKKATGKSFETLEDVLSPESLAKAKNVLADLGRKAESERLAGMGTKRAGEILEPFGLPGGGMLQQEYSIFKTVLNRISKSVHDKTLSEVADALKVPERTLHLLRSAPDAYRQKMINQIIAQKLGRGAIAAGAELSAEGVQ